MIKRICPHCGEEWFSADTTDKEWPCFCGHNIPKTAERPVSKEDLTALSNCFRCYDNGMLQKHDISKARERSKP